jgi:hypothetical protein
MDDLQVAAASAVEPGKTYALVNFAADEVSANYLLVQSRTVKVRADVVQFQ